MGLLGNLVSSLKKAVVGTVKEIPKVLDTISGIVTNPITAVTKGTDASTKAFTSASPVTNTVKTITNVGLVAAAVTAAAAPAAAATAAKTLIPTTTKGKVIAAVATPIVAGAVIKEPAKTVQAAISAPSSLANFGGNAATLIANPSIENAKTLLKENPVVSAVVGGAAVAAIGGGVGLAANTIATFTNSQATKANTASTLGIGEDLPTPSTIKVIQEPNAKIVDVNSRAPETPVTAQTQTLSSGSTPRKKKRSRKAANPSNITQKVNVIVSNKSSSVGIRSNRRFINKEVLPL